jgi:hypothetical protein
MSDSFAEIARLMKATEAMVAELHRQASPRRSQMSGSARPRWLVQ